MKHFVRKVVLVVAVASVASGMPLMAWGNKTMPPKDNRLTGAAAGPDDDIPLSVSGKVVSQEDGEPIIGASVIFEGTNVGTVTDIDGAFNFLSVPRGAKRLKVSYIGMRTAYVTIKPHMSIELQQDNDELDEVIVVAYGTAKKSTFTGSASVIKTDKLSQRPVTEVSSALLGSAPGVSVTTSTGMPGESSSISIRGIGSFSASSTPLVIVDGMPYEGAMSNLNPSDIESMTVLKDAASTALYGARAANGVLMITTKAGKKGKMTVNVKFNQGITARQSSDYAKLGVGDYCEIYWENLYNKYQRDGLSATNAAQGASQNLMTTLEYNPFLNVEADKVVGTDGKFNRAAQMAWSDTDWEDAIEQLGSRSDMQMSVNGGSDKADYYASVGYTDESGYIIGSDFKRLSLKTNINATPTKWLKMGLIMGSNISKVDGVQNETKGTYSNPFLFTRYIGPIYPIYLHDAATGSYILDASGNRKYDFGTGYGDGTCSSPNRSYASPANPAIELAERTNKYTRKYFNAKGYAEFSFLNDFKFKVDMSVTTNNYLKSTADKVYEEKGNVGTASRTSTETTTYDFDQLLTYHRKFGRHDLDALIGHESYKYDYSYLYASMKGEILSGNNELSNYTEINNTPTSYANKYRTEGYFMRANYNYDDLYYASLSFRRDGSSRFHKDSRWGSFWSAGAGWSISRTLLADVSWIDNLKLRLSYGEVGNDDVGSYYPWVASYEPANNTTSAGYIQSSMGNKNLKWEVSHNFDVALEFGFLSRFTGSLEYFHRKSSNLLFDIPLSLSTGFDSQEQNAGAMYNAGIELQLGAQIVKSRSWQWSVDVNGTYLKNKITTLPVDPFFNNTVYRIEEGHSRYEFYLKQWRGVNPATGDCLYEPAEDATQLVTVDGKEYTTSLSEAAYGWSGSGMPTFTGGFSTTLGYKNVTLSASFYYQLGGKIYDTAYQNLMTPNQRSYNNLHTDILNRWQQAGDVTSVPRISDGSDATDLIGENSTRWLTSSDMLELANVVLNYEVPKPWLTKLGLSGLKLYVSGENLFSITARKGLFPRQYAHGYTSNADTFAPARAFTAGINVSF